jgi:hypothetical protein
VRNGFSSLNVCDLIVDDLMVCDLIVRPAVADLQLTFDRTLPVIRMLDV